MTLPPTPLTFPRWFQTLAMAALAAIALFVGDQLRQLNASVQQLTREVAVSTAQVTDLRDRLARVERRQDAIDGGRTSRD